MNTKEIIQYLEMVRPIENYSHTFSVSVGDTRHFGPGSQLNKDVSTAIDLAIKSLEKQIPKKPNIKELPDAFGRLYWNVCGACDEEIESDYTYCPDCGQKINWEESP